jgi:hypothetical protein
MVTPTLVKTGAFGEPAATFGNIPQGFNQGGTLDNFVPEGEVWIIHAASVGQTNAGSYTNVVCSLHVEQELIAPEGSGSHIFALMGMRPCPNGTPFLALDRPIVLLPRMRLGARFLSPPEGLHVSVMAYGFKYPIAQLPEVLHGVASGSGAAAPDFTALLAAAHAAAATLADSAAALATLSQSAP